MSSLLHDEYKESRLAPPRILRRMVLAGVLGRKSGKGFYDYSTNPPSANEGVLRR
jgi:3-hydroxybutyryl-CoA dehydrogenase